MSCPACGHPKAPRRAHPAVPLRPRRRAQTGHRAVRRREGLAGAGDRARVLAELERLCASDLALGQELLGWRPWPASAGFASSALLRLGRGGELDTLMGRVRNLLGDSDNSIEQVSFHSRSGQLRALRGDTSGALEHGRQALEWGMRSQNLFIRLLAHTTRGRGLLSAGRLDEALDQLEQALVLAIDRAQGMPFAAAETLPLLAEAQLQRGDVAAARAAAALDARDHLPRLEEVRAELAQRRGDRVACERALRTAARLHRENGEEWQATQAEARIGA